MQKSGFPKMHGFGKSGHKCDIFTNKAINGVHYKESKPAGIHQSFTHQKFLMVNFPKFSSAKPLCYTGCRSHPLNSLIEYTTKFNDFDIITFMCSSLGIVQMEEGDQAGCSWMLLTRYLRYVTARVYNTHHYIILVSVF